VLPTNFKNFLLDQPKNSAAGEKVQPLTFPALPTFFSALFELCGQNFIPLATL
jgi:hypothetical protein